MCVKRQNCFILSVSFFMCCFVSVNLWLSYIHYVYKVPYYSLQQFFEEISIKSEYNVLKTENKPKKLQGGGSKRPIPACLGLTPILCD